jgi:hypothetical protein
MRMRAVFGIIAAAFAAIVLGLLVLLGHHQIDLLAAAALAAGVGLLCVVVAPTP